MGGTRLEVLQIEFIGEVVILDLTPFLLVYYMLFKSPRRLCLKTIIFALISFCFAGAFAARPATLESESIRMVCESNGSDDVSIVSAKFNNNREGLYVKNGSNYQSLALLHNLNDSVFIYQSNDFILNYYSFSTGKKTELVKRDGTLRLTCNSLIE